ncbi:MAG: hypothetical protein JWO86_5188 [Myxococcaceae bacterium]|jgi:hypothetical protein|nr:hypothetical protein [Myxococcaceae bacterium]
MRNKNHRRLSFSMLGLLVGAAAFALITFSRELPAMRRYLRIRSM